MNSEAFFKPFWKIFQLDARMMHSHTIETLDFFIQGLRGYNLFHNL